MTANKPTILIADDSGAQRMIFTSLLREWNPDAVIVEAVCGRTCLEVLQTQEIDLAFIDVHMPHLSGLEACGVATTRGRLPFVVIVSGEARPEVVALAKTLKVTDYLPKPVSAPELRRVLDLFTRTRSRMRALIIDDSGTVRTVIRKVLANTVFHFDVDEASCGLSGFETFAGGDYDLVVLDLHMPGVDGLRTSKLLKSRKPLSRLILTSSNRGDLENARADGARFDGILPKPFRPSEMDDMIRQVFGLKTPFELVA